MPTLPKASRSSVRILVPSHAQHMGGKTRQSLGQALIRQQHSNRVRSHASSTSDGKRVLESVIDVRDLDTVVEQAELAGRVYSSINPLPEVLVSADPADDDDKTRGEKLKLQKAEEALNLSSLKIPRRPKWHGNMTPEQLDVQERQSFLHWRRQLARLEENELLVVTPFEKNIDIWRQLWRVIERSDLVVTVVDARNPLFYRCADLEAYVKEIDSYKQTILLVNKADLIPVEARLKWAKYFKCQCMDYVFWSAKHATEVFAGKYYNDDDTSSEETKIMTREELLNKLQAEAESISRFRREASRVAIANHLQQNNQNFMGNLQKGEDSESEIGFCRQAVVGFVGYPNVGKSSTINALVGEKRTGVTSTPGKTKHFQTLIISDKLMLCDSPGLVFPSFTSSRSDMVAFGVLSIDRLTDHRGPVQVVANLVPRASLEQVYGILLPKPKPYESQDRPPAAYELLHSFCQSRGYVASAGLADETRAARQILKDFVSGKLLHFHLPPSEEASNILEKDDGAACSGEVADKGELLNDLDSFDAIAGLKAPVNASKDKRASREDAPSHKMHKKAPRRKDRSWRAGNDKGDGMPVVRGVAIPVSHDATRLASMSKQ